MKISMQAGSASSELSHRRWQHAIVGEAVNARGEAAIKFAKENSDKVSIFRYDPDKLQIHCDDSNFSSEEPEQVFDSFRTETVLLESTTLGFVEILLCCRGLKQCAQKSVSLLYTEPRNYFRPRRSQIVHRHDFELSEEVHEFMAVPGNVILLSTNAAPKCVVFLGFEGQRLNRFLEQTGIPISKCSLIFGVPAFHPGWEMHAFANNLRILKGEQMAGRVFFCGAQNILSAYEKLNYIHNSFLGERLLVTPIGTKPHGVGAALFLSEHPDVGVIYDYPKKKEKRSDDVETWHLFEVEF